VASVLVHDSHAQLMWLISCPSYTPAGISARKYPAN